MFTELVQLDELLEEDSQGKSFINGSKLRTIHRHLQQGVQGIHFSPWPCVVSVEEMITGPSSEIVFKIDPLCSEDQLLKIEIFFRDLIAELSASYHSLNVDYASFNDLRLILSSALEAAVDQESKRVIKHFDPLLSESEIEEMRDQLVKAYQEFIVKRKHFVEKCKEFQQFMQSLDFFSRDRKDGMLKDEHHNHIRSIYDEAMLMDINSKNILKESAVYGELLAMKETVDAMLFFSKFKSIDNLLGRFVETLNEAAMNRLETIKNSSVDNKRTNTISFDNVSCFSCKFWPSVASEWRVRDRRWPSNEDIKMIVDAGCFVVPKQSVANDDQHKLEWRWSFSQAEMKIAALRKPKMNYCYFVFKSLFYAYLKPRDDKRKSLPSYVAKTCMFHLCEHKEETWWNTVQISECVYDLMTALRKCLEVKTLCHYFIKELNLLDNVDDEVLRNSLQIVNMLLENPVKYFAFDSGPVGRINDIKEEIRQLDSTNNVLSFASGKEAFKNVVEMCYEEKVKVVADYTRNKYLIPVYMLLSKKVVLQQVIQSQEKFLQVSSNCDNKHVNSFLHDINTPAMKQLNEDLQKARDNAKKVLGGIRDLRKTWCIICDGRCKQLIPCGVKRFKCRVIACNYDICMECYSDKNSFVDGVFIAHEHTLESTTQCSPYCYSQITEERLGTKNFSQALHSTIQKLGENGEKLQDLAARFGIGADYFAKAGNHGEIMSEKLANLHKCLGLSLYNEGKSYTRCPTITIFGFSMRIEFMYVVGYMWG